jgi:subtilisin-like proprotein convertase family protein
MNKRVWIGICLFLAVVALTNRHFRLAENARAKAKALAGEPTADGNSAPAIAAATALTPVALTNFPTATNQVVTANPLLINAGVKNRPLMSVNRDPNHPFRLSNSRKSSRELFASETAVLLRNAFIETTEPIGFLEIPEHLKSEGDPRSYVVQSRGRTTDQFREILKGAGARIVSYIPHNSYLVQASSTVIAQLRLSPMVQAALPYEPYYKLDRELLPLAIDEAELPVGHPVRIALFPGTKDEALKKIRNTGALVFGESEFPYGPLLTVFPNTGSLVALARLPEVQLLEVHNRKVLLNDLARVRVGVATNGTVGNLHGLDGSGVVVGVNGSGIDGTHPDLVGRVINDTTNFTTTTADGTGHETHVAAIIAGSGTLKPGGFTNGSSASSLYAGKAPAASVYPISILPALASPSFANVGTNTDTITGGTVTFESGGYSFTPSVFVFDSTPRTTNNAGAQLTPGQGASLVAVMTDGRVTGIQPASGAGFTGWGYTPSNTTITIVEPWSDFQLVTNHARHTNIYVVNNSWSVSLQEYDTTAATYDAAVRDSMPHWSGEQGINYVFAAGNSGFGTTSGQSGLSDTIESPAIAKNVIAVGAIESLRNIPATTNVQTALEESDSDDQVANFSSRGNAGVGLEGEYGRFKPDLVAPGTWILSATSSNYPSTNLTTVDASINNSRLRYESGTSMAAPVVSGMLALMQQYFAGSFNRTNSPALNKALLINGARPAAARYGIAARNFANLQGWGVPALTNTLPDSGSFKILDTIGGSELGTVVAVDQSGLTTNRLKSGQTHNYQVTLSGTARDKPLRVTLLWTDPPANPGAGVKLVNDLDLVVSNTASADVYLGNFFVAGSDFTSAGEPNSTNLNVNVQRDFVNNVENVFIRGPFTNSSDVTLDIRVVGERINVNATEIDTNAIAQDYVLVVSTEAGESITLKHTPLLDSITNYVADVLYNGIPVTEQRVGGNFPHTSSPLIGSTNQWRFYVFTNQNVGPITNVNTNVSGGLTNSATNVVTPLTNAGQYVAFATFLPPNLGRARIKDADVDIYATRSTKAPTAGAPNITNLVTSIFTDPNTLKATNRGGLEILSMEDSVIGEVFHIAVKSEDQQGGEFGFIAISSADEFTQRNPDGTVDIPFFPAGGEIPDGAPSAPGGITMFGISVISTNLITANFTNSIAHEAFGDITAILTHNTTQVYLWNHNSTVSPGIFSTQRRIFDTRFSDAGLADGPGEFADFMAQDIIGLWTLTVIDDGLNHTGQVLSAGLHVGENSQNRMRNQYGDRTEISFEVDPGESFIDFIYVPFTATNLEVSVASAPATDPGIDLLVAFDEIPAAPFFTNTFVTNINGTNFQTTNVNINTDVIYLPAPNTATNTLNITPLTDPILQTGLWFARVVNNTSSRQSLTLIFELSHSFGDGFLFPAEEELDLVLVDMAATNLTVAAPFPGILADVGVSIGIDHPRPSDLVLHLISPAGKKVLLFENRGSLTATNLYANFTEASNLTTSIITDAATGAMDHYTNLIPIKAITNQFTNAISPPLLLTSNLLGVTGGSSTQPEALVATDTTMFLAGSLLTNISGDSVRFGMAASYPLPLVSNTVPTNWLGMWPGPNSSPADGDVTDFKDLVVLPEGVFMVASENLDYYPVVPGSVGFSNEYVIDVDTGCTEGTFSFTIDTFNLTDHFHAYYEGAAIVSVPFPGIGTAGNYLTNVSFGPGSDSFVRLVVNQGGNTNTGTAWNLSSIGNTCTTPGLTVNRSVVIGYPTTGPFTSGNGESVISRGVTNNPYGIYGADRLFGITSAAEDTTNMLYVVGSALYSGTADEKFFISKLATDGRAIWTATEQVQASATATVSGGVITGINLDCPGTNYSAAPTVRIVDQFGIGMSASVTASIGPNGNVTGFTSLVGGTGYERPKVYIDKPALPATTYASAGRDVVVNNDTNIFTFGFSNVNAAGTSVVPTLRAYDTNGCLIWARNSASGTDGPYYAGAISRTNLYAVGAHDNGGGETASTIEKWDLNGNLLLSTNYTHLSAISGDPFDSFDDVIALTCPDRIYAIGTRTNGAAAADDTDAILVEIDPASLRAISTTVIDKGGSTDERGVGLSSDGRDLYALIQTTPGGVATTEVFRFRIRNYYQPEESLENFQGDSAWFFNGSTGINQDWTLRIWDTRAGGTNATPPKIKCWGVDFTYSLTGDTFTFSDATRGFTGTLLGQAPQYYSFTVPPGVNSLTLNVGVNSAISAAVSINGLPSFTDTNSSTVLVSNGDGGQFVLSRTNGFNLYPGTLYLAVKNGIESAGTPLNLSLALDGTGAGTAVPEIIPLLANGVLVSGNISAGPGFSLYSFDVPVAASGAHFELSPVGDDLNLYLRKGDAPRTNNFDYRSVTPNAANETIFLVPDAGTSKGLTEGTWFLGVENKSTSPQNFSIKGTSLAGVPYNILPVNDGETVAGSSHVGNAPHNMYRLTVGSAQKSLLFEVRGLSGEGDLIVGKGQPPLASSATAGGNNAGVLNESVAVRTNSTDATLTGDWYFGVVNQGETDISYTAVAKLPTGGLLISETPVQLKSIPTVAELSGGGSTFGFDLDVVPGETYQVQFAHDGGGPWFILTNILAPQSAVIEFVHANALTNRHLFYRVQQVNP